MDTNSSRSLRGKLGGNDETSWQPQNVGSSAASGRSVTDKRVHVPFHRRESGSFVKLRGALASDLPQKRRGGFEIKTSSGANTASLRRSEEKLGEDLSGRAPGSRFFDGSVDSETYSSDRPEAVSGAILHRKFMESDEFFGMELPEAAEESQGTQRASDSLLEISHLASYKKRPLGLEPAWSSWMRAGSRSSPTFKRLGHRKEKPPSLLLPDAGKKSRRSRPSPSRLKGNASDSTHASMPTEIFGANKSDNFSGISRVTSRDRSFFSGTAARSTKPSSPRNSLHAIRESARTIFRDTPLSSIPTNSSGQTSNAALPIVSPKTSNISGDSLAGRSKDFGIPSAFSDRAFTHPNYRGHKMYPLTNERSVTDLIYHKGVQFLSGAAN